MLTDKLLFFRFQTRVMLSLILMSLFSCPLWAADNKISAVIPASFPPYFQLNEAGQPEGFAIDVMDEISRRAGYQVEYTVKENWEQVFKAMRAGKADLIPNVGATSARSEYMDFTSSVETFHISLFIREDSQSEFKDYESLSGRKIGAVKTNVGYKVIKKKQLEAVAFDSFEQAFYALLSGQVDALAYPESVGWKHLTEARQEHSVVVLGDPLAEIRRVIGVRKDKQELLQKLNLSVAEFIVSKKYPEIYLRWFSVAPPFWTIKRIFITMLIVFGGLITLVIWWRYHLLKKNKESLDRKVRERTEQLNDTNKLLQNVLDTIPSRVFWKDLNNVYLGCNKKFAEDAGENESSDIIDKDDFDFPWADRADMYRDDDSQVMSSGHARLNYEEPQTTPDGNTIWLETSKIPLTKSDGKIYGVLGIYQDITPRKQMEEELTERKQIYAVAEKIAHIGSWHWNIEMNDIVWSDEVYRIFGYQPNDIKPDIEIFMSHIHKDDQAMVENELKQAVEDEQAIYDFEHRYIRLDGREGVLHEQGQVYRDDEGKAVSMIGTSHDVTEIKMAEQALITARDEAEEASRAKSLFLSNMSHELRTPLHGILSYADFGVEKSGSIDIEKVKKYFSRIRSSGERLKILLDDLLDISKLEAGKMELFYAKENIQEIINECVLEQKALLKSKDIKIRFNFKKDAVFIDCDKNRIGQVIMNLLSNAIKFSPDDTEITFTVDKDDSEQQLDLIRISVLDQGIGVDESEKEAIFDKFVQSNKRESNIAGTGLGLALSRELIEAHQGKIWCQQGTDKGAEFVIQLPVAVNIDTVEA